MIAAILAASFTTSDISVQSPPTARDAIYPNVFTDKNDGTTTYRLTVKGVPVDAFWSVTVRFRLATGFEMPVDGRRFSRDNLRLSFVLNWACRQEPAWLGGQGFGANPFSKWLMALDFWF